MIKGSAFTSLDDLFLKAMKHAVNKVIPLLTLEIRAMARMLKKIARCAMQSRRAASQIASHNCLAQMANLVL